MFCTFSFLLNNVPCVLASQFCRAEARALIHPEALKLYSPGQLGCFCQACKLSKSGFSVIVNNTNKTVARDTFELKFAFINSLKALNVRSGNPCSFGMAATIGKRGAQIYMPRNIEQLAKPEIMQNIEAKKLL